MKEREKKARLACDDNPLWCVHPYLRKLPGNTDGPAQAVASNEKRLHSPTPKMAERKNVKMAQDSLPGDDMAIHSILLQATGVDGLVKMTANPLIASTTCTSLTIMSASLLA